MTAGPVADLSVVAGAGDGPWSPYEPVTAVPRYGPPRGRVGPPGGGWIGRMWPVLRSYRTTFTLTLLCAAVALVAQVAVPRVTMAAIDEALAGAGTPLTRYAWALLALAAVRGGLSAFYRFHLSRIAHRIEYDLRVGIYEHLARLSFSFYDRVQSGQLIARANSDIRSVQMFLTFAPLMALNVVTFVVALSLMVSVHPGLTLVAVLPLPFVYFVGVRMRSLLFPVSWIVQARVAEVATVVEENVTGVRVVKSFAAEEQQIRALTAAARRLRWASGRQVGVRARYSPLLEALPRAGMALVLLYGGWLAIEGAVSVGAIVAFSSYVVMLHVPFRMLGFLLMMGQRAAASASRIFEVLDERPELADRPGAVDLIEPHGEVELRNVRFAYAGAPPVLDGVSLHLRPGETVALVGRTGSGKSTIARLVARFYDVSGGEVLLDGHDVRKLTLASVRAAVGVVFDEPFLFSASIRDNIAYGRPDASPEEVRAAAAAAGAAEFIERLPEGYATVIGERGYTLSGGQRQRIALARMLLVDPAVLVLDDATTAIDAETEQAIHAALRTATAGRTKLLIAHRLSTIGLADRVVLLQGGRIVAAGTHRELMEREPRYVEVLASIEAERAAREAAEVRADARIARRSGWNEPDEGEPFDPVTGGFGMGG